MGGFRETPSVDRAVEQSGPHRVGSASLGGHPGPGQVLGAAGVSTQRKRPLPASVSRPSANRLKNSPSCAASRHCPFRLGARATNLPRKCPPPPRARVSFPFSSRQGSFLSESQPIRVARGSRLASCRGASLKPRIGLDLAAHSLAAAARTALWLIAPEPTSAPVQGRIQPRPVDATLSRLVYPQLAPASLCDTLWLHRPHRGCIISIIDFWAPLAAAGYRPGRWWSCWLASSGFLPAMGRSFLRG